MDALKYTTFELKPWFYLNKSSVGIIIPRGIILSLADYLSVYLKRSLILIQLDKYKIKDMLEQGADVILAPCTLEIAEDAYHYSNPFYSTELNILSGKPFVEKTSSYEVFKIFQSTLWLCILAILLIVSLLQAVRTSVLENKTIKALVKLWLSKYIWSYFGTLCGQNFEEYAKKFTSTSLWWVFRTIVATLFVSGLLSAYAKIAFVKFDSISDLTKRHNVKLYYKSGSAAEDFLLSYDARKTWQNTQIRPIGVTDVFDLHVIREIQKGTAALLAGNSIFSGISRHCKPGTSFYISSRPLVTGPLMIRIAKHLNKTLIEHINQGVTRYNDFQLVIPLKRKYQLGSEKCIWVHEDPPMKPIKFENIQGIFYALLAGMAICTSVLSIEVAYFQIVEKKLSI